MATNFDINAIVKASIEALTPTLAQAIATAIASVQTAQTAPTDDKQTAPTTAPRKGGFHKKNVDSQFEVVEGEINICEYSEKSIAIWGDTKDKTELIDYIKSVGTHEKHKANFVTPLSAIASRPVGWTINKTALEANGGWEEFVDSIEGLGFKVNVRESVKDVFEANKAAREASKTDKQTETPKTPTPTPTDKGKGKSKTNKPSIAPTDSQRNGKKNDAPKTAPKVVSLSIKGSCYDNSKDTEEGYKVTERELIARGNYYVAQGSKGARIYAKIGKYVGTERDLYACIAIVKGNVFENDCAEAKTWTAQAKDIIKAVKSGSLKASNALMYAYVDAGDQSAVDTIFENLAA